MDDVTSNDNQRAEASVEEEIYSRWGTDPAYYFGSDDKTEATWARADAKLLVCKGGQKA